MERCNLRVRAFRATLRRNVARPDRSGADSTCQRHEKTGTPGRERCNCALPVARLNRRLAAVPVKTETEITSSRFPRIWIGLATVALIALVAAFFLDHATAVWIGAHSSPELKRVMQTVSRVGDWPAHFIVGLIGIAIAFVAKSKMWMRIFLAMLIALALAGVTGRAVKFATG